MDRVTVQYGQVPLETDLLQAERFTLTAVAKLSEAMLGTATAVAGFTLTATATPSLSCNLSGGQIYEVENLEATAWSSLAVDTHSVVKQGILLDPQVLTFTPPAQTGYAQYALVQATYLDADTGAVVRPYYNAANPTQPYSGPGNAGTADNTIRKGSIQISIKYGVAATSGAVAPTADPGYAPLFLVSLAFGQTTIGAANISVAPNAPFIPVTLPGVPAGVQTGQWMFGTDTGVVNAMAVGMTPSPTAYVKGQMVVVVPAAVNNGPATMALGALNAKAVIYPNGSPFLGGELQPRPQVFIYDGSAWEWQGQQTPVLQMATTFYVSASGSDSNNGQTSATPFATGSKAAAVVSGLNANGQVVTIKFADGTYAPFAIGSPVNGTLNIVGNVTTPSNCLINTTTGTYCFGANFGATVNISGFKVTNSAPGGHGLASLNNALINFQNMDFGACSGYHLDGDAGNFSVTGSYTISGGANVHAFSAHSYIILTPSTANTVTLNGTPAFSAFVGATNQGFVRANANTTYSGSATGTRYSLTANSVVNTSGAGANFFPGNVAGTTASGAQYL